MDSIITGMFIAREMGLGQNFVYHTDQQYTVTSRRVLDLQQRFMDRIGSADNTEYIARVMEYLRLLRIKEHNKAIVREKAVTVRNAKQADDNETLRNLAKSTTETLAAIDSLQTVNEETAELSTPPRKDKGTGKRSTKITIVKSPKRTTRSSARKNDIMDL